MADKKADSNFPLDQFPLEGQAAFPGFEIPPAEVEPEQEPEPKTEPAKAPDPEPLTTAEAISEAARKISWQMDFIRSPEDALIAWGAPAEYMQGYLTYHFEQLVNEVARETGADPEQIRDKNKRTPEQQKRLTEIAGQEMIDRHDVFRESIYYDALTSIYAQQIRESQAADDSVLFEYSFEDDVIEEQAAIYFFALHSTITPLSRGTLTADQEKELINIYEKLADFYREKAARIGVEKIKYGETLEEFIRRENPSGSKAKAIIENLPVLQNIIPAYHTMPNNTLMNDLTGAKGRRPINAGPYDMVVGKEPKSKKEITSYTTITYDSGGPGAKLQPFKLTEHERQVSDAIVSCWREADEKGIPAILSIDTIYGAMIGGSDRASEQQTKEIRAALEKFMKLRVYVNATEEAKSRGADLKPGEAYIFDEYYLNIRRHRKALAKGGKTIAESYEILSKPVIYAYSEMTNQYITVPAKCINIMKMRKNLATGELEASNELLPMTKARRAIAGYIVRQIAVMRRDYEKATAALRTYNNRRRKNPTLPKKTIEDFWKWKVISFDTLFSVAGLENIEKQDASRYRKFVMQVLDYEKSAEANHLIAGYEMQTKGRSITGVKILF